MIEYTRFRLYTQITNGLRFRPSDGPYLIIYFPENGSLLEEYPYLNLKKEDIRHVITPITKVPRTHLTLKDAKTLKSYGLTPLSTISVIPKGKNVIYDLSIYLRDIASRFDILRARVRRNSMIKNIVTSSFSLFPTYRKVLLYTVNVSKPFDRTITNRLIFPILELLKEDQNVNFDDLVLCLISPEGTEYRLLMKNNNFNFNRLFGFVRLLRQDIDNNLIKNASEKVTSIVMKKNLLDPPQKDKFDSVVQTFVQNRLEKVHKILDTDDEHEIIDVAAKSALSAVVEPEKAEKIIDRTDPDKKEGIIKAISKNIIDNVIPPTPPKVLSNDPSIKVLPISKIVKNSPEHILKRREVFEDNLKKDVHNSFKILETKDVPVKVEGISIVDKPSHKGEVEKSENAIIKAKLRDEFSNIHDVEIEIPKIDVNTGVFTINGRKKCLINQIVLCPISFLKPYEGKFESSYSTFHIISKRSKRTNWLEIYIAGYKLPLLIFLAFAFGFDNIMKDYGISYKIQEKKEKGSFNLKLTDSSYLVFDDVDTELKIELVNSLIKQKLPKLNKPFGGPDYFNDLIISLTGRINSVYKIRNVIDNIIDPPSKQILINKMLPFELDHVIKYMAEKVVSGFVQDRNDLSCLRIRSSEVLVHLIQKQILAAYTTFREQVLSGNKKAKFTINPVKVKSEFLNSELVTDMEFGNPCEELSILTRISPLGKGIGGIPGKDSVQLESRNVHNTYFGNIDPLDTPEGANIGMTQQLTVSASLTSSRGLIKIKDKSDDIESGLLSTSSCMIPFIENNEGARVIMADSQIKQALPLKDPEPPAVMSGYESVLAPLLSDNFIKKSPITGEVKEIKENEFIRILSTDKKLIDVDISPALLKSGSGKNGISIFKPTVSIGQKVQKGSIIAEGSCIKNATICLGRNLCVAIMPYKGYNYEDGVVINERLVTNDKLTSLHFIEEDVLVGENDRIIEIISLGSRTNKGDILLKKTVYDIDKLFNYDEDETSELIGGNFIKKSPGGFVADIEVFSNINDPKKLGPAYELYQRTCRKYNITSKEKFTLRGKIIDGTLIRFKIQQELKINIGDKLCNRFGNKGIVSLIEKDELMPRTPWGETVDIVINPLGLINRMNMGQLYELYCGLISKEIARRIRSLNKNDTIKLLKKVMPSIDGTKNKVYSTSLISNFEKMSDSYFNEVRKVIVKNDFFPIIIPPFQAPKYKGILDALNKLNLKTKYPLHLPEFNCNTPPCPVGYMYIEKLEHLGDLKIYARSTGPVVGKVFQPTKGKSSEGGQRLGEMESFSFISYGALLTLNELFGPLSDDLVTKNEIISEIIEKGQASYKITKTNPTKELLRSYFISLMLDEK